MWAIQIFHHVFASDQRGTLMQHYLSDLCTLSKMASGRSVVQPRQLMMMYRTSIMIKQIKRTQLSTLDIVLENCSQLLLSFFVAKKMHGMFPPKDLIIFCCLQQACAQVAHGELSAATVKAALAVLKQVSLWKHLSSQPALKFLHHIHSCCKYQQ